MERRVLTWYDAAGGEVVGPRGLSDWSLSLTVHPSIVTAGALHVSVCDLVRYAKNILSKAHHLLRNSAIAILKML